jgi:glutaminyl-peptide cyclotransferase
MKPGLATMAVLLALSSCGTEHRKSDPYAPSGQEAYPLYTFQVINSWPHDRAAFTQGLVFYEGALYESTGLYGHSSLRQVDLRTGDVQRITNLPAQYFAEGMTIFQGKVFQLTWKEHIGFIYDLENFSPLGQFSYEGEGWGLTHDEHSLILSDGTNQIRFIDPQTFRVERVIDVYNSDLPLKRLNELEYIKGEIYANVWQTNWIVRIDPQSGKILGWIDLTGLLSAGDKSPSTDVLNGIAYDQINDRFFVTGKLWPKIFEIRLLALPRS